MNFKCFFSPDTEFQEMLIGIGDVGCYFGEKEQQLRNLSPPIHGNSNWLFLEPNHVNRFSQQFDFWRGWQLARFLVQVLG